MKSRGMALMGVLILIAIFSIIAASALIRTREHSATVSLKKNELDLMGELRGDVQTLIRKVRAWVESEVRKHIDNPTDETTIISLADFKNEYTNIECISNCKNNRNIPKVFKITIVRNLKNDQQNESAESRGINVVAEALVHFIPARIADNSYSILNEQTQNVVFGQGTHHKVYVNFEDPDGIAEGPLDMDDDAMIYFAHSDPSEFKAISLSTNLVRTFNEDGSWSFKDHIADHGIPAKNPLSGEAGASEYVPYYLESAILKPEDIRNQLQDLFLDLGDSTIIRHKGNYGSPTKAEMRFKDSCEIEWEEWEGGTSTIHKISSSGDTKLKGGEVILSLAPEIRIVGVDGGGNEMARAKLCQPNLTFLAIHGSFHLVSSVIAKDDTLPGSKNNRSLYAFATARNGPAIIVDAESYQLPLPADEGKAPVTFGSLLEGGCPKEAPDRDPSSFLIHASIISPAGKAIEIGPSLRLPSPCGGSSGPKAFHFGPIRVWGSVLSGHQSPVRFIDTSGETVAGFIESQFDYNQNLLLEAPRPLSSYIFHGTETSTPFISAEIVSFRLGYVDDVCSLLMQRGLECDKCRSRECLDSTKADAVESKTATPAPR